jgi:regulator of replication initiation timing
MQYTTFTFQTIIKLFTALFLVVLATGLYAQATLSVQGVLTKSDGTAVDDGTYSLKFRLFDDSTGGNQVHTETITVETIGGVYSTILGKNSSSPLTASFSKIYYLSVVAGSTELLPRPQLTHAPYALSLLGQSNKFPSTGLVKADSITVGGNQKVSGNQTVSGNSFLSDLSVSGNTVTNGWIDAAGVVQASAFTTNPNNTSGLFPNGNSEVILKAANVDGIRLTQDRVFINNRIVSKKGIDGGLVFEDALGSGIVSLEPNGCSIYANGYEMTRYGSNGATYFPYDVLLQKLNSSSGNSSNVLRRRISDGLILVENSSRRYKKNIRPLVDDFRLILKSQPVVYTGKSPDSEGFDEIGYIAEEMDSIGLGRLVIKSGDVIESFSYDRAILYAVEVLKMQDTAITQLQAEVAALKAEKANLHSENTTLRIDNETLQAQQANFSSQLNELSKRMKLLETSNEMKKSAPGKK